MTDELTERVARAIEEASCGRIFDGYIAARAAIEAFEAAPQPALAFDGQHPVETLWRKIGLPEYFLGNGGSNHKLYALYDAIRTAPQPAPAPEGSHYIQTLLRDAFDGETVSLKNIALRKAYDFISRVAPQPTPAFKQPEPRVVDGFTGFGLWKPEPQKS